MTHSTYYIAQGRNTHDLMMTVNKHIRRGWEPLGGIAVEIRAASDGGEYCVLHQALIRYSTSLAIADDEPRGDSLTEHDKRLRTLEEWRETTQGDGR